MATSTTLTTAKAWHPDVQGFLPAEAVPDALILAASVRAGEIEGDEPAVRVPYVADDGEATVVEEAQLIPDVDADFDEVVVRTSKVSALGKFSRESLAQPNAAQLILASMQRSIVNKADRLFVGSPSDPTGLLNAPGITDGGLIGDDLDSLIDAASGVEADGGAATDILAAPDAWAALSKMKTATGSAAPLLGAGTAAVERFLLGIPVRVSAAVPAGQLLMLDRRAVVSAYGQVQLARSDDAFFASDVAAIRVTWRIGWSVMRPGRVVKLGLTATVPTTPPPTTPPTTAPPPPDDDTDTEPPAGDEETPGAPGDA